MESKDQKSQLTEFCQFFRESLMKEAEVVSFQNTYGNRAQYTEFIKTNIMKKYAEEHGLNYWPEYYTVDHTFWTPQKNPPNSKVSIVHIYKWDLQIVIEHENYWRDWTYEVAKLDFIHAPLKIVIGYSPNDKRQAEQEWIEAQRSQLRYLNDEETFAVILMNQEMTDKSDPFGFRCYLLKEKKTVVF